MKKKDTSLTLRMTALVVGNALCEADAQTKRKDNRTVPLSFLTVDELKKLGYNGISF